MNLKCTKEFVENVLHDALFLVDSTMITVDKKVEFLKSLATDWMAYNLEIRRLNILVRDLAEALRVRRTRPSDSQANDSHYGSARC